MPRDLGGATMGVFVSALTGQYICRFSAVSFLEGDATNVRAPVGGGAMR